jgi:hypothetical protein
MSIERELLERWLDDTIFEPEELDSLMEETRELLAQPEQEQQPEAWILKEKETGYKTQVVAYNPSVLKKGWEAIPLYAGSPKREPLSFEDLNIMWCGNPIDFARRIESIHGIGG